MNHSCHFESPPNFLIGHNEGMTGNCELATGLHSLTVFSYSVLKPVFECGSKGMRHNEWYFLFSGMSVWQPANV